ncbi:MAG: hypothetical protein ACR2MX_07480 [Cyclobacteriaceae bacterium]
MQFAGFGPDPTKEIEADDDQVEGIKEEIEEGEQWTNLKHTKYS